MKQIIIQLLILIAFLYSSFAEEFHAYGEIAPVPKSRILRTSKELIERKFPHLRGEKYDDPQILYRWDLIQDTESLDVFLPISKNESSPTNQQDIVETTACVYIGPKDSRELTRVIIHTNNTFTITNNTFTGEIVVPFSRTAGSRYPELIPIDTPKLIKESKSFLLKDNPELKASTLLPYQLEYQYGGLLINNEELSISFIILSSRTEELLKTGKMCYSYKIATAMPRKYSRALEMWFPASTRMGLLIGCFGDPVIKQTDEKSKNINEDLPSRR